ncbi:MAG: HDOD domain-containing protein [Methylophilaceae bacterium]
MNLIDNFFEQLHTMPMLPKVVQEVTQLLNTDDVEIKTLADKINHDQVLSARVLSMSNSAYFGCSRGVSTIEEAISLIGLGKLKTLVIASGVTSAITDVPGLDLKRFWRHSLITASIARELSTELNLEEDTAYIAALMHTVGQLPIHMLFPTAGAKIEEACQGRNVLERTSVEHMILGIDHTDVGAKLAKHWNFPEEISQVILYYTEPLNEKACSLAPVVYAASHIAFDLESGKEPEYIAETLSEDVATELRLEDTEALAERIESYRGYVAEAKAYL